MTPTQRHHYRRTNISQAYLTIRRGKRPKYLFINKQGHLYPYAIRSKQAKQSTADPSLIFVGLYDRNVNKDDLIDDINEELKQLNEAEK